METKISNKNIILFTVFFLCLFSTAVLAAVGCTLNAADRDVRRLFPQSTGYRTNFVTIQEKGGEKLKEKIEDELGEHLDNIYEAIDVPYAYYDVLKGKEIIGRVHGVNQKGTYGGMQLIIATDLEGKIISFYYQKISSPEAGVFTDKNFTSRFTGLKLDDFMQGTFSVPDPSKENSQDFQATLRGLKKNLILLKEFVLDAETREP